MSRISVLRHVSQVFSPAATIFTGIGVLLLVGTLFDSVVVSLTRKFLQAAKDTCVFREMLSDLFGRIEMFFMRLEIYIAVPATTAMTGIIIEIMVGIMSFLAMVTKEIKQGRASEYVPGIFVVVD